jgi:hypothetical protein
MSAPFVIEPALRRLREIETKNGGLINGNFSFVAHQYKLKVSELRNAWEDAQYCVRCEAFILDWSTAVEDADGQSVCGECHEGAIDQTHDEMKDARGMGELGGK